MFLLHYYVFLELSILNFKLNFNSYEKEEAEDLCCCCFSPADSRPLDLRLRCF